MRGLAAPSAHHRRGGVGNVVFAAPGGHPGDQLQHSASLFPGQSFTRYRINIENMFLPQTYWSIEINVILATIVLMVLYM